DGWIPDFFQQNETAWALSIDYPVDAAPVLDCNGGKAGSDSVLQALAEFFERDPAAALRQLSPPYAIVWSSDAERGIRLQNDGLGFVQLYEYDGPEGWAISNRIFAFKALGLPLEPIVEQWAVRVGLGWFPLDQTGFRNVRYLSPGTQLRLTSEGLERKT